MVVLSSTVVARIRRPLTATGTSRVTSGSAIVVALVAALVVVVAAAVSNVATAVSSPVEIFVVVVVCIPAGLLR